MRKTLIQDKGYYLDRDDPTSDTVASSYRGFFGAHFHELLRFAHIDGI